MTTLDPRGLEAAAEVLCRQIMGPRSNMGNVGIRNATRFRDEARAILDAYLDVAQPVVTTVDELEALPVGIIVRSAEETIAGKVYAGYGVVFGDDRPFPWTSLALPARVIWRPHESP